MRGPPQFSIFANLDKDSELDSWNEGNIQHIASFQQHLIQLIHVAEYHIKNIAMDLSIIVGGNVEHGIIPYIQNYGFYEGGHPINDFRIGSIHHPL
jgi:hypothetical protein